AAAAIATEASDTFDGVSRAWNYIFVRPWQVIFTYGLTFTYMGIFCFCGHVFEKVATKSLSVGPWGMGHNTQYVDVDKDIEAGVGTVKAEKGQQIALPGKAEFLYRRLVLKDPVYNDHDENGRDVLYYKQTEVDGAGAEHPMLN